ncbi:MAG: PAS domain S-box protein [Natronomonas sp.]
MKRAGDSITVLSVDDDPAFLDLVETALDRAADRINVITAPDAREGLDRLKTDEVDCIVSDYDMPAMNGLEFLRTGRVDDEELPFILFTGKGSEEIASEAISAGVTDYLQKGGGGDKYALLANRIENAVDASRADRERRRQLDAIETAQEGISILEDDRFIYVNDAYADLYGYEREELIDQHWEILYPDDDIDYIRDGILPLVEAKGQWHGRTTGVRSDGTTFEEDHVLATTAYDELVCTVRDVSDRKQREQDLEMFETMIETISDGVYALDTKGRYVYANTHFEKVTGYDREEVLGESPTMVVKDLPVEQFESAIREIIKGERDSFSTEVTVDPKTRDPYPADVKITALIVDEEFQGTVGVTRDISERKAREQELKRQKDRIQEFVSIVSHDLRNPLNVASGRLELLKDEPEPGHVDAIEKAHDRMEALIENLLTLAHEGEKSIDYTSVDLERLVDRCWRTVRTDGAEFSMEAVSPLRADEDSIRQLLENLLRNAIEHGGADLIRIGPVDGGFYLEDDGTGIPEDHHDQVFESGFSTTSANTGFGLAIVEEIVETHGWDIDVTKGNSGGARFEITGVEFAE